MERQTENLKNGKTNNLTDGKTNRQSKNDKQTI